MSSLADALSCAEALHRVPREAVSAPSLAVFEARMDGDWSSSSGRCPLRLTEVQGERGQCLGCRSLPRYSRGVVGFCCCAGRRSQDPAVSTVGPERGGRLPGGFEGLCKRRVPDKGRLELFRTRPCSPSCPVCLSPPGSKLCPCARVSMLSLCRAVPVSPAGTRLSWLPAEGDRRIPLPLLPRCR